MLSEEAYGHIELIIGPMFAGKTTELMRRVRRELHAKRTCYVIKHSHDVRYNSECVSSHDMQVLGATAAVAELREIGDAWRAYQVVAVDEGQFFPDIVEFCNVAADAGKTVIVSALDGDYRRRPFDGICRLIPLAETVKKLSAVCMECHSRSASFTYRTVSSEKRELIGGADMYIAACRRCFISKSRKRARAEAASCSADKLEDAPQDQEAEPRTPSTTEAGAAGFPSPLKIDTKAPDDDKHCTPKERLTCD
ncbi:thymidine kinase [Trypanosoma rangeli]|uniref:Thymidine kinase n=1 Tax=Trypanosoma rangeli TaxID=5698 RepID=A0A3R7KQH5_TRYRA|nr:thymidine kinase [Trypanosoma rangeli]RNE99372.1 thymidine kinase [Trypanosoma rangeli]|eukprot:RNE99372.1 thymidine kinase [Trypanosoma rangeli]